ncbi:hypothetical protein pdam_00018773, partial [Pocillopora damicornis]
MITASGSLKLLKSIMCLDFVNISDCWVIEPQRCHPSTFPRFLPRQHPPHPPTLYKLLSIPRIFFDDKNSSLETTDPSASQWTPSLI